MIQQSENKLRNRPVSSHEWLSCAVVLDHAASLPSPTGLSDRCVRNVRGTCSSSGVLLHTSPPRVWRACDKETPSASLHLVAVDRLGKFTEESAFFFLFFFLNSKSICISGLCSILYLIILQYNYVLGEKVLPFVSDHTTLFHFMAPSSYILRNLWTSFFLFICFLLFLRVFFINGSVFSSSHRVLVSYLLFRRNLFHSVIILAAFPHSFLVPALILFPNSWPLASYFVLCVLLVREIKVQLCYKI